MRVRTCPARPGRRLRRRPTRVLLVALVAVVASACGVAAGDGVVATVNGVPIRHETLEILVRAQALAEGGAGTDAAAVDATQQQTLGQLIQNEIVTQSASELGIEVPDEDIDEQFEQLAAQFGGVEGLRDEIARRGRTEEDVRDQLAAVVLQQRLAEHFSEQAEVDDATVRAAYEERSDQYQMADVSHILVPTREEAEEILGLLEGGADFAALAEERSIDEFSAVAGGSLGENPRGSFVAEFDDAVWSAQIGEVIGPVETEFGFHVIRVDDRREIPFEEVAPQLREELAGAAANEAFDRWFLEVLAAADVRVDGRYGAWDHEQATVTVEPLVPEPPAPPGEQLPPLPGEPVQPPATGPATEGASPSPAPG